MYKTRRKTQSILLIVALILTVLFPTNVSASEQPQPPPQGILSRSSGIIISPFWTYTSYVSAGISKGGTTIYPSASIIAEKSNYKITGTLYLERRVGSVWTVVKEYAVSGTGWIDIEKTFTNAPSGTYRTRVSAKVSTESVSATSSTITIS